MARPKLKRRHALPIRCSYLDTDDLVDRLKKIYKSDDNFQLEISNDRIILYAVTKLTKEQLQTLIQDPGVYSHYPVVGGGYHMGPYQE